MQEQPLKLNYYSPRARPAQPILAWVLLALLILGLSVGGVFVAEIMVSAHWRPRSWLDVVGIVLVGIPIGIVCIGIATVAARDSRRRRSQLIIFAVVGTLCVAVACYCLWALCDYAASV